MPRGAVGVSVIKKGAKVRMAYKKANLKRPSRALYTKEERDELTNLRSQNRYYNKRIKALSNTPQNIVTVADIQDKIPNGYYYTEAGSSEVQYKDDPSNGLRAKLYQKGYFDDPGYSHKDIRLWMIENNDFDLLNEVMFSYNYVTDDPNSKLTMDIEQNEKIPGYSEKLHANQDRIEQIKQAANDRKQLEKLRYLDQKHQLKTGNKLLEDLSKGRIAYDALSDPEKAAVRFAKNTIVKGIFKVIDFENINPEYVPLIKRVIYASVMEDPIQGLRDAASGIAALKAGKKYGNDAADFAAGMMDTITSVMTGKPNLKPAVKSAFGYMVQKSPLNKDLMYEISESLVDSGQSTHDKENDKMLARDIGVDIIKDVISTGGNIYAAIPMILKDVLIDTGNAKIRKFKYDKKDKAEAERRKKQEEAAKKAQKEFKERGGQFSKEDMMKYFGDMTDEEWEQIKKELKQ